MNIAIRFDDEELGKIAEDEKSTCKELEKSRLAKLLLENFTNSVIGLIITLAGLVITLL
jgi:hypothetical protein